MKKCTNCSNLNSENAGFCENCGLRFKTKNIISSNQNNKEEISNKNTYSKVSYVGIVKYRMLFKLINSLAFIIPPLGIIAYFYYKDKNQTQSIIFLVWAILGTAFFLGLIN